MAKFNLFGGLFRESVWEGMRALVLLYWPVVLPVLVAAGQLVEAVPWPYFYAALAVSLGGMVWFINQINVWRDENRIDNKVELGLLHIEQKLGPAVQGSKPCLYAPVFVVPSISKKFLYMRTTKIVWEMGGEPKESIDFEDTSSVLGPGTMCVYGPTIDTLKPDFHSGKFKVTIQFGKEEDRMKYELSLSGTFYLASLIETEGRFPLEIRWKKTKRELRAL